DFVSFLVGNGDAALDNFEVSYFDPQGALLERLAYATTGGTNDPGVRVTKLASAIGSVRVRSLGGRRAVGLDDFEYGRSQHKFAYQYQSHANDPDGDSL